MERMHGAGNPGRDAVAIKIDPERDHELETLLEAARAQVRGRAV